MLESLINDPLKKVIFIGFIVQFLDDFFPPTMALIFMLRNSLSCLSVKILKSITLFVALITD